MSVQHLAMVRQGSAEETGLQPAPFRSPFLNRDLSLVQFFRRVLEEAQDSSEPLLERLKFISILSSNLDEFFMIRVSGLKEKLARDQSVGADGFTTEELLQEIRSEVEALVSEQMRCLQDDILPALSECGIRIRRIESLTESERHELDRYFETCVYPLLTPQAVDPTHPFPYISAKSVNLGFMTKPGFSRRTARLVAQGEEFFTRVKIPQSLPPTVSVGEGKTDFVMIDDLIVANISKLVPGVEPSDCHYFRITRDADIELRESETEDMLEAMEENLKLRRFGDVVRLEVSSQMPQELLDYLVESLQIGHDDVYRVDGPLGLNAFSDIYKLDRPDLKDTPILTSVPEFVGKGSLFDTIRERDVLLHHPYTPYSLITDFIRQAVEDPEVLAIKMCLYRIGAESSIAPLLIKASESGKQVTVLIEIKARFDEANNIEWAKRLERAGVHVIYGHLGLKTHCKTTLVVRRENGRLVRYAHIATGNYNPETSPFYTDLSLLTARDEIGADATELFNYLTAYARREKFKQLVVAPIYLREKMLELIRRETEHAREGRAARIVAKMNRLADTELVTALYDASRAGVSIDLIVRGVCTVRPGVPGMSENIRVRSIVGRFLEHSRVYYFENGGAPEVYTGSSDWMPRNLDRRIEVLGPVHDSEIKRYLSEEFLGAYLRDNVKARELQADGTYRRVERALGEQEFAAQLSFQGGASETNIVQFESSH